MTEKATFPTQQLVNGELIEPPPEGCIACAERVFKQRQKDGDTNPQIVQMKSGGYSISHWYYRSDQWIEQPYLKISAFIQPYVGPSNQAQKSLYGEGSFVIDKEMTIYFTDKYKK